MNLSLIDDSQLKKIKSSISEKLSSFKNVKVLTLGDIGIDEYIHGQVHRISPEAPVPVLDVTQRENRLGLAANVAKNVAHLSAQSQLISVVGDDQSQDEIKALCLEHGLQIQFVCDPSRPTTKKTRVIHDSHHIVRIDEEKKKYISKEVEDQLLANFAQHLPSCDVVIVEDYNKGVVTERVCQEVIQQSQKFGKPVFIDPHIETPVHFYKGADLLKPNINEVYALLKQSKSAIDNSEDLHFELAQKLMQDQNIDELLLTLGKDGMAVFSGNKTSIMPTVAKQVYDVTGAGDTVIAVLALGRAIGLDLLESSFLGNLAAGFVVSKVGTVSCSYDQLLDEVAKI